MYEFCAPGADLARKARREYPVIPEECRQPLPNRVNVRVGRCSTFFENSSHSLFFAGDFGISLLTNSTAWIFCAVPRAQGPQVPVLRVE